MKPAEDVDENPRKLSLVIGIRIRSIMLINTVYKYGYRLCSSDWYGLDFSFFFSRCQ